MAADRSADGPAGRRSRVGVFGGTFDPPHIGHVTVATDLADGLALDRLIWVPAREPPHREPGVSSDARVRLEMTRAAARADERFEVSTLELERSGRSFTVDTLAALRADLAEAHLFLIIGVDQFRLFDSWERPREILEQAHLAIMDRDGASAAEAAPRVAEGHPRSGPDAVDDDVPAGRVFLVPVTRIDVSSTEVREAVRRGLDVSELVPAEVIEIVERERLYRDLD